MIALGAPKLYHNFGAGVNAWCKNTTVYFYIKPGKQ